MTTRRKTPGSPNARAFADIVDDRAEELRRHGQIEDRIALHVGEAAHIGEAREVSLHEGEALLQPVPHFRIDAD